MTMEQYLINRGFEERAAYLISSNFKSAKGYYTKAIEAYNYGQVSQVLISNWNQGDKSVRNALDHLIWKRMMKLM